MLFNYLTFLKRAPAAFILLVAFILAPIGCEARSPLNYRKLVDTNAKFVGKGITVEPADNKWDWFLPDLHSLAQQTSAHYQLPANPDSLTYVQSFRIDDDIGYVWRWFSGKTEVFLIYTFLGRNGYFIRTLHNTHNITKDEAILAVYFDHEFKSQMRSFNTEKWVIEGTDLDNFDPEALRFLGEDLFQDNNEDYFFDGRVITLPRVFIIQKADQLQVCNQDSEDIFQKCFTLPQNFGSLFSHDQNLADRKKLSELISQDSTVAHLKIELTEHGHINSIIGGAIYSAEFCEDGQAFALALITDGYLGSGSQPLLQTICDE